MNERVIVMNYQNSDWLWSQNRHSEINAKRKEIWKQVDFCQRAAGDACMRRAELMVKIRGQEEREWKPGLSLWIEPS